MGRQKDLKLRTWLEINRAAILKNYSVFRNTIAPQVKLMGIVKSNAYGNELFGFAKELDSLGIDSFGVDSLTEGLTLREQNIKKEILVLGYTIPENLIIASKNDITVTISSFATLLFLEKNTFPLKVHIKIDTGMHRQGFFPADAEKVVRILRNLPHVSVQGVYTHFANAKDPQHSEDTDRQAEGFLKATEIFENGGFYFLKHTCATGGTLLFPKYHFDMVRIGIGLHGLWPAKETEVARGSKIKLSPVLVWKTIVAETKTVKKGESIGYDFTETLKKDTKIAILPIGYWHGFSRALSSTGHVLIKGKRAKVLGRVAMDMVTVDIDRIAGVKAGDEVVIIGKQGKECISAEEMADIVGTTNYEIMTRINPKIKRVFV